MDDKERNVVIVTGAGASCLLGEGSPLPLMADWAKKLRLDLERALKGFADAVGLSEGIDGTDFEQVVGKLLRWRAGFDLVKDFWKLGAKDYVGRQPGVNEWMTEAERRGKKFEETLWESLWREFGLQRLSPVKAATAYKGLIAALHLRSRRFVVATTNYDLSVELALQEIGLPYTDGFEVLPMRTPVLQPDGIVDWKTDHGGKIPVLHLHGAVGWYKGSAGGVERMLTDKEYNVTLGLPAVVAPDPDKDPESDPDFGQIWQEFKRALEGATDVLVIGHSLTDRPLHKALSGTQARIAVVRPEPYELVGSGIPDADPIEGSFGGEESGAVLELLSDWFRIPAV